MSRICSVTLCAKHLCIISISGFEINVSLCRSTSIRGLRTIATGSVADRNVMESIYHYKEKGAGEKREMTTMANTKDSKGVICVMQHKGINY